MFHFILNVSKDMGYGKSAAFWGPLCTWCAKILVFIEAPYLVQFLEQKENKSTETKRTYSTNQLA